MAASDLSRLALPEELALLRDLLEQLGETPEDLDQLGRTWERNLQKQPGNASRKTKVVKNLRRQALVLGKQLEHLEDSRRLELAELILQLDGEDPRANEELGRELHGGRWLTAEEVEGELYTARLKQLAQDARRMEIEVSWSVSTSPLLAELYTQECNAVSSHGLVLHSPIARPKLERMLRQSLRAAALSNALLGGELEVPEQLKPAELVMLDSEAAYQRAVKHARDAGGIDDAEYNRQRKFSLDGYWDGGGWYTISWAPEATCESVILWRSIPSWLGHDAQPCLLAGHLNWLCLNVFGTTMPAVLWRADDEDDSGRTVALGGSAFADESLWRAARQSLYGCRSWMAQRVRAGRTPRWSSSMKDQLGKIAGEALLTTTLVVELLQERGTLAQMLEATRSPREDHIALFEEALSQRLPEFEAEWARWLLRRPRDFGLVQSLLGPVVREPAPRAHVKMLEALNEVRARALAGQAAEFEAVSEDSELSDGALAHARYLARNEDQMAAWPDAHEEYPDRDEFSVEGARAGLRSVIYPHTKPAAAIEGWMSTFYHRLPLIEPGLFGVGIGIEPEAVVLAPEREHWVAWPPDGEIGVPIAFVPELPNPVPGEDQASFGYPITLQVNRIELNRELQIEVSLHLGDANGPQVDCHLLSPTEFFFAELVPPNAWCLIPKRHLRPRTSYTFRALQAGGMTRQWSFKTGAR